MTEFYQEMQRIASGLFRQFGQGVIEYVKITPGAGTGDNPGVAQETPYTVDAVARGVKFKYVNGTSVVTSDLQITMGVRSDVTPTMEGFIRIDGVRYKIIQVATVPPAGIPVAHRIIFRK